MEFFSLLPPQVCKKAAGFYVYFVSSHFAESVHQFLRVFWWCLNLL